VDTVPRGLETGADDYVVKPLFDARADGPGAPQLRRVRLRPSGGRSSYADINA